MSDSITHAVVGVNRSAVLSFAPFVHVFHCQFPNDIMRLDGGEENEYLAVQNKLLTYRRKHN